MVGRDDYIGVEVVVKCPVGENERCHGLESGAEEDHF